MYYNAKRIWGSFKRRAFEVKNYGPLGCFYYLKRTDLELSHSISVCLTDSKIKNRLWLSDVDETLLNCTSLGKNRVWLGNLIFFCLSQINYEVRFIHCFQFATKEIANKGEVSADRKSKCRKNGSCGPIRSAINMLHFAIS